LGKIKIILVDDHQIVRDGIKAALTVDEGLDVVAEASSGKEALEICKSTPADIIVMDIGMPEMNGIKAATLIKNNFPEKKILLLTMYDYSYYLTETISEGIEGYILKVSPIQELIKAIYIIFNGETYFDPKIAPLIKTITPHAKEYIPDNLTKREIDIMRMIAAGKSSKDISSELFVSFHTVKNHRRHIMSKLKLKNTAELIQYCVKNFSDWPTKSKK
jgi:DNA-binding NarL/FixJ family response regulator